MNQGVLGLHPLNENVCERWALERSWTTVVFQWQQVSIHKLHVVR